LGPPPPAQRPRHFNTELTENGTPTGPASPATATTRHLTRRSRRTRRKAILGAASPRPTATAFQHRAHRERHSRGATPRPTARHGSYPRRSRRTALQGASPPRHGNGNGCRMSKVQCRRCTATSPPPQDNGTAFSHPSREFVLSKPKGLGCTPIIHVTEKGFPGRGGDFSVRRWAFGVRRWTLQGSRPATKP
jgi:hypothetical protein